MMTGRKYTLGPHRSLHAVHYAGAPHVTLVIIEGDRGSNDRKTIKLSLEDAFSMGRYFTDLEKTHQASR